MFFKLLKHDFTFSARAFLVLAVILLGLSAILRFTLPVFTQVDSNELRQLVELTMMLMIVGIGIASITQIFQFFNKNFFSESGYLMLTLPTGRFRLLISKIIVSFVWFNFMLAAAAVSISLMWNTASGLHRSAGVFSGIGAEQIRTFAELNTIAFFAITLLFFCMTFARSTFAGRRIHGIVAGVVGFVYGWLYFWIYAMLGRRSMEFVQQEFVHPDGHVSVWSANMPQAGLVYGRIQIYELNSGLIIYIDIFQIALSLAMGGAAIAATYYLLKRRTSLK